MLVEHIDDIADLLACPRCGADLARTPADRLSCSKKCAGDAQPVLPRLAGKDVLVDFDRSVLDREATLASGASSVVKRGSWRTVFRHVVDGTNPYVGMFARMMLDGVKRDPAPGPKTIVMFGAGEEGYGSKPLYEDPDVRIVAFDIYASPIVTFVADAHNVPVKDASVDGVWLQGMLEFTIDPRRVVAEASRILKPGGFMFTDTTFMFPLCEKAYDFHRWSPSGLRWLFRDFTVSASGQSTGPGTMAALAIRYLLQSLLRSTKLGQIAAFPFVALRFLDRFCADRRALDASVGMFMFGRKALQPIDVDELIAYYDEQPALFATTRRLARDATLRSTLTAPSGV
ncbi:methyltransferase domain-containing protein [Sphingomonas sp. NBWT7]|uniref:class I SAM-dependent methyltransferase n=1 Tax=Sphingomonas sp. NBWT7 TaxID=2596913 RepID=UPI0016284D3B|nr:class I SAM-dependent methyltransferase [Sphingomonas sp. NBWT7]QNE31047.1 methyltransferase domain-containing protein [Sphingomonas sp. NBWT7]